VHKTLTPNVVGLRCRECGATAPTGPVHVCSECFGPLRVDYDPATEITRAGKRRHGWLGRCSRT
jgi:hypothetical protein